MKILIVHKWLVAGGVERILVNYLKIFKKLGIEADLIIKHDLEDNFFQGNLQYNRLSFFMSKEESNHFYEVQKYRKRSLLHKLHYEYLKWSQKNKFLNFLKEEIRKNQYDIIINFSDCLDFALKQNIPEFKVIRWIHGQLENTNKSIKNHKLVFSNHNKVVCICDEMKSRIINLLSYEKENIITLYNPINVNEIQENSLNTKFIDEGLLNQKYMLQVSRLCDGKGHFELIEIYKKLKDMGLEHKLYFIGDGENREKLANKIKEFNLTNDCLLLGEIKNPYPYFKNADLFVHTSESEGLPTVLLESMALGTPVVAMDCPTGPKEILGNNNEYGYLIDMHDQENFIEAVYKILNDDKLREEYSKKAISRSLDFSDEKIAIQIDKILKEILSE